VSAADAAAGQLYSTPVTIALRAITSGPLDPAALQSAVCSAAGDGRAGAVATFVGLVRGHRQGRDVLSLDYEAYEPLALKAFGRIDGEVRARWPEVVLGLHHRVGRLAPGEASIAIVAASPHRAHAFAACRFVIERVKQIAPIWKRERFADGEVWVEGATADPDDDVALREAEKRACA
jgi:molybdopterin synthase catalytic subunit